MSTYKVRRFKHVINEPGDHQVWVYGKLKYPEYAYKYESNIIISKNLTHVIDFNMPVKDSGYNKNLLNSNVGGRILKYLDRNGKYRVYPFNCKWSSEITTSSKGVTNTLIKNLLTAQSNKAEIGKNATKTMSLVAHQLDYETFDILSDIFVSPIVYMYIGDGVIGTKDTNKDWLRVTTNSNSSTILRDRKQQFRNLELTITLPETFTFKSI